MTSKTLDEIIYHFQPEREVRPVLLLGAGCSFSAGIPVAAEMVRQIARFAYATTQLGVDPDHTASVMEGDIRRFLQQQSWFREDQPGEMFPHAVQELLTPSSIRRKFFQSMMSRATGPSSGHEAIGDLVQRQLVQTILTTNFDSLIEDALLARRPHIKEVVVVNKSEGDITAFAPHNAAQIIYLHGAFEYYRDRNTIEETKRLDKTIVAKVRPMLAYAPLIVIGYRGYEPSVMEHLLGEGVAYSNRYAYGVFWCTTKPGELHDNVKKFADRIGSNFSLIQIASFDEAMQELNAALKGRARYQSSAIRQVNGESAPTSPTYDAEVCKELTLQALDRDQVFAMAKQYASKILKVDLQLEELDRFLESYAFARRDEGGVLHPTLGLYLLTGRDVTDKRPHLKLTLWKEGKEQIVFSGSLLTQFSEARTQLLGVDMNPVVRIKRPEGAIEMKAFHDRAIIELLVNLMAHRDYGSEEFSLVRYDAGRRLEFCGPGGLPETVYRKLKPDASGNFKPQRNVREIRNPIISDVFFSQGVMDKAGTGLVDVVRFMEEHYGAADFAVSDGNRAVRATLVPAQSTGDVIGATATPVAKPEVFLTNLLPFISIPSRIFELPLEPRYTVRTGPPLFPPNIEDPARELVFVRHSGALFSFADFRRYPLFAHRVGYLDYVREYDASILAADEAQQRIFVQLLGRHWERFLVGKKEFRLYVDYRARHAYFLSKDGAENAITYDSPQRKNVTRTVVKKRETPTRLEFENEGVSYSIVHFGFRWAVQLKPFYVFTDSDGKTPLRGIQQTRRATRRYKFDRNKAVEADMRFWSLFLSGDKPTLNLAGPIVPDLVLSTKYLEAEALPL